MLKSILLLVGLTGSLCICAFAQADTTRWLALMQMTEGKVMQVKLNSGRTISGTLIRGDESTMVLRYSKGESIITREEIREIRVREGRGHGGRAKLGAIIGGSVGGAMGALSGALGGAGGADASLAAGIAIGVTGAGAGIGAVIGAAIPNRYTRAYTAPAAASGAASQ